MGCMPLPLPFPFFLFPSPPVLCHSLTSFLPLVSLLFPGSTWAAGMDPSYFLAAVVKVVM